MSSVTVLCGPERRRRWPATEKARIVEESFQPGAVVAVVARRHDVHANLLHYWRRQARQAAGRGVTLLPVSVSAEKRSSGSREGAIEIELSDVRVRVDATVDEAALGRVLRALGR
jgi:transposase